MSQLRIMTCVWGQSHIQWFEKTCVRCLSWPRNNQAVKDAKWMIFTRPQDSQSVVTAAQKTGIKDVVIHHFPAQLEGTPKEMGLILLQALDWVMDDCLKNDAKLLMAPPDSIFSEGSIPNILQLGRFGKTCVAVPHPRVNASIFGSIKDEPLSSRQLVQLAFKHQHKAWSGAQIGVENQSTYIGGIAWEKLSDQTWYVQHMLPTVYLASFLESDKKFFHTSHDGSEPVFGAWDHLWPSELIINERWRMPGSTDLACIVEVTKEDQNIPAKYPVNPKEPDAFWRCAPHNKVLRQFPFVMCGEQN